MADILNISELVSEVTKLFQLITQNDAGSVLSALGFFILVFAFLGFRKVAAAKPEETPKSLISITICAFAIGITLAAAGPTVVLLQLKTTPIIKIPKQTVISRLKTNDETRWLIRLIAYDPTTDDGKKMSIGHIQQLGPPNVEYTFVTPYEELKGYSVGKALSMVGSKPPRHVHDFRVSAIIFQSPELIIPASARGLVQLISMLENDHKGLAPAIKNLDHFVDIDPEMRRSLHYTSIPSYAFENYGKDYEKYCRLAFEIACHKDKPPLAALSLISEISRDWHPSGSALEDQDDFCPKSDNFCRKSEWEDIRKSIETQFGARVFFIRNLKIESLGNRYLIDFGNPDQLIPEIGIHAKSIQE